jgi:hypothetical protein
MIIGGVVAIFFGVAAEGKPLEEVATPLSVIAKPSQAIFRTGVNTEGVDPLSGSSLGYGSDSTLTGPEGRGAGSTPVPDPRLGDHDDPSRPRPPDDDPPLA